MVPLGAIRMKQWKCDRCKIVYDYELPTFRWTLDKDGGDEDVCPSCCTLLNKEIETFFGKIIKDKKPKKRRWYSDES